MWNNSALLNGMVCVFGAERREAISLLADSSFEISLIFLLGFAWMEQNAAVSHAAVSQQITHIRLVMFHSSGIKAALRFSQLWPLLESRGTIFSQP